MDKKEKVILGLKYCAQGCGLDKCPYFKLVPDININGGRSADCDMDEMMLDALELIDPDAADEVKGITPFALRRKEE